MNIRSTLLLACLLPTLAALAVHAASSTNDAPEPGAEVTKVGCHPDFSWVLVRQDGSMAVGAGNSDDWQRLKRERQDHPSDYLWFKTPQGEYEIVDPAIVARVGDVMLPMQRQGEQMQLLGDQMESRSHALQQLSHELDQWRRQEVNDPALEAEIAGIQLEMDRLGEQMDRMGQEQQASNRDADETVFNLIQTAIAEGNAAIIRDR
ncbi:hypothetical protein [Shewanella salipaludis]|uniref:DUF2884 family protein n=1 Tax=Shewanella salipaludis TaxID=2723052 RepID=A0A972FV66_9GAMM|nr:hypothetical protein [Shewanella salipaludis]NMH66222.1 hypothetical protein [Shewanella salipaludis]